jgi:hypothetical protein
MNPSRDVFKYNGFNVNPFAFLEERERQRLTSVLVSPDYARRYFKVARHMKNEFLKKTAPFREYLRTFGLPPQMKVLNTALRDCATLRHRKYEMVDARYMGSRMNREVAALLEEMSVLHTQARKGWDDMPELTIKIVRMVSVP